MRALTAFLTLADTLHFGRAADACHMSPSTLTRAIKQLEQDAGATLFERDNRSVTLTREGELFRQYALEARALWRSLHNSLQHESGQLTGTLQLYSSVTASYSFLFDLLAKLRTQHPGIRLALQTGDPELAVEQVQSGKALVSIGARPASMPAGLVFKTIATTPLVFIAPKTGTRRGANRIDGPVILPQRGVARERVTRWFRQQRLSPDVAAQVAGNEAIVSMVSLGSGVGVVPRIVLDNSPIRDRVRVLPIRPVLKPLEVGLFALRKNRRNRLVDALWAIAR
ncbi:MAG: HTH-type transcriptional activator IlvY [Pseudomonadota bacterium]